MSVSVDLPTLQIVLLGVVALLITLLVVMCKCQRCVLLDDDPQNVSFCDNQLEYGTAPLDSPTPVGHARSMSQPTSYTRPENMKQEEPPPRYEDLYGSEVQSCNLNSAAPVGLLDQG